eukprot:GHVT01104231.1.p1 GENE.GHVT01104231.1~~GHVT01104231.1.p1  ORF type:complete len:453 (-),score=85.42 GHVT01104231.1:899-2257(-)
MGTEVEDGVWIVAERWGPLTLPQGMWLNPPQSNDQAEGSQMPESTSDAQQEVNYEGGDQLLLTQRQREEQRQQERLQRQYQRERQDLEEGDNMGIAVQQASEGYSEERLDAPRARDVDGVSGEAEDVVIGSQEGAGGLDAFAGNQRDSLGAEQAWRDDSEGFSGAETISERETSRRQEETGLEVDEAHLLGDQEPDQAGQVGHEASGEGQLDESAQVQRLWQRNYVWSPTDLHLSGRVLRGGTFDNEGLEIAAAPTAGRHALRHREAQNQLEENAGGETRRQLREQRSLHAEEDRARRRRSGMDNVAETSVHTRSTMEVEQHIDLISSENESGEDGNAGTNNVTARDGVNTHQSEWPQTDSEEEKKETTSWSSTDDETLTARGAQAQTTNGSSDDDETDKEEELEIGQNKHWWERENEEVDKRSVSSGAQASSEEASSQEGSSEESDSSEEE